MSLALLDNRRIGRIFREIRDVREVPGNLRFLNRLPIVSMTDQEMSAYWDSNITIAPIVPDGARASVDVNAKLRTELMNVANIKHGAPIPASMLQLIEFIQTYNLTDEVGAVDNFYENQSSNLLEGVRQTQELFAVSMALDSLLWSYRGVNFSASWGTKADLKVTLPSGGAAWTATNHATSKPISDVLLLTQVRTDTYSEQTTRITMRSADFRGMIASDEFAAQAKLTFGPGLDLTNAPTTNTSYMQGLASRILNMEIELYDQSYWIKEIDGTDSKRAFMPQGKVILSDKSDDNSQKAALMANTKVTEAIMAKLLGQAFSGMAGGGLQGDGYGPLSYMTAASHDANPPGINIWAVARCFPMLTRKTMYGVLDVGTGTAPEALPIGQP